jgi:hypothetical protein
MPRDELVADVNARLAEWVGDSESEEGRVRLAILRYLKRNMGCSRESVELEYCQWEIAGARGTGRGAAALPEVRLPAAHA